MLQSEEADELCTSYIDIDHCMDLDAIDASMQGVETRTQPKKASKHEFADRIGPNNKLEYLVLPTYRGVPGVSYYLPDAKLGDVILVVALANVVYCFEHTLRYLVGAVAVKSNQSITSEVKLRQACR